MSKDYFRLDGKVALVTGASSGLGAHFADVLASEGVTVVLAARRADRLAANVELITALGGSARAIALDVTRPDSVGQMFEDIAEQVGPIDILVNNAGVSSDPTRLLDTTEDDWSWVLDTNLDGAWRVATQAAKQMVESGKGGSIVNMGSIYGLHTGVQKIAYNVSKAAVVQMTKTMAIELSRMNIRVNALCPGWFVTELNEEFFSSDRGQAYIKKIPMGRVGALEDLTVPLLMLVSDAGAYITGTTVTVDGGIVETPI